MSAEFSAILLFGAHVSILQTKISAVTLAAPRGIYVVSCSAVKTYLEMKARFLSYLPLEWVGYRQRITPIPSLF